MLTKNNKSKMLRLSNIANYYVLSHGIEKKVSYYFVNYAEVT